ncbi:MAG: deoxyguanosinetriphosphate triphosphohydrolase [Ahrensia sp.]|nr:deoxyguanosinetriphosphate triphosphohydrolase [Ahrensia sp.]
MTQAEISGFNTRQTEGLAVYAEQAANSRGRLIEEPKSPTRSDFQRDRDRIIHSDAFRRLMHKTQVFVHNEGDHYRTRLTHSIEVGQIARALARAMGCDEDLAEALALAHDFGHTPFGHAGERVLDEKLKPYGGFDHNVQALRVVTRLERRYAGFNGLNLTWETLEGLVKHNGPLADGDGDGLDGPLAPFLVDYNRTHDLWLWSWPSIEAQCAAIADDIAYDNHDLDDGLRAGLFTLDDLANLSLSGALLERVRLTYPLLDHSRSQHELVRRQITAMVEDVISESLLRITDAQPSCADDVRYFDHALVGFSPHMRRAEEELKAFLFERMYRSEDVMAPVRAAQQILGDLFDALMQGDADMPPSAEWALEDCTETQRAEKIADYLAGMTDRYAVSEHRRLFDHTPQLR